jgi:hypothetical protein
VWSVESQRMYQRNMSSRPSGSKNKPSMKQVAGRTTRLPKVVLQFPPAFCINPSFRQSDCSACYLRHANFLHELFFEPEDRGDMFL